MPPNNAGYMHTAYVAAVAIYTCYAVSIWWRTRSLRGRRTTRRETSPNP